MLLDAGADLQVREPLGGAAAAISPSTARRGKFLRAEWPEGGNYGKNMGKSVEIYVNLMGNFGP